MEGRKVIIKSAKTDNVTLVIENDFQGKPMRKSWEGQIILDFVSSGDFTGMTQNSITNNILRVLSDLDINI